MLMPKNISTVIIGAGHAGLSFSRKLVSLGIDHIVLERGDIGNSWKKERWDSLKLLTPNYKFKLPNFNYDGANPNGFMSKDGVVDKLNQYANSFDAPVYTNTTVKSVDKVNGGYLVSTTTEKWLCKTVVIASGAFSTPVIPELSEHLPDNITQMHSKAYKNPTQLNSGSVLVVGASSSGLQIANELIDNGFNVHLSVSEHVRMPRSYRGKDIFWWLDESNISTENVAELLDKKRLQKLPSPQLIGSDQQDIFDLNYLQSNGVNLVGKLSGINQQQFLFSGGFKNTCKLADLKLNRLLNKFDELGIDPEMLENKQRFLGTLTPENPKLSIPFKDIRTVIWATGLKPDYGWLNVPVINSKGLLNHSEGMVNSPGMFVLGLPSMIMRQSSYIHGICNDTEILSKSLLNYLSQYNRSYAC